MNRTTGRQIAMFCVIATAAVVLAILCFGQLVRAQEAAARAAGETADCRRWAASIGAMRVDPRSTPTEATAPAEIAGRVAAAAHKVGVSDSNIERIDPRSTSRVGRADNLGLPTELLLRSVTMRQLIELLCALDSPDAGGGPLRATSLRLSTSPGGTDERWTAQVTLVQASAAANAP